MPYLLSQPAIKAILKAWHPKKYRPPYTDVEQWIDSIESLCVLYGIPDVQRLQCAAHFIKDGLRQALVDVAQQFGIVHWNQFKALLIAFDEDFRRSWEQLPFWKRHPKYTGAAIIVGGIVLVPLAGYALTYVGLTSAGFATGGVVITYESIAYGSAVRLLALPALQAAGGTATIMPTFGAVLTGAATAATGAGLLVASTDGQPDTSGNLLQRAGERITRLDKSDGDDCGNPPQHTATAREEYLTPLAVSAIVKAWDVGAYDPPRTDCATWLDKVHDICEQYEIPEKQRARCASHHMGPHSQEAVRAAGCYSMTWDEFAAWIRQYDYMERESSAKALA